MYVWLKCGFGLSFSILPVLLTVLDLVASELSLLLRPRLEGREFFVVPALSPAEEKIHLFRP